MADSAVFISSSSRERVDHDVFISYSRRDSEFAQRLLAALQGENRDTWVDWQSIQAAEDFWQAIEIGIEAANTFVFILSPDSCQSEYCNKEIDHAVLHHKRLIPVVCHDVEPATVHPALRPLDWIFFRETDEFAPSFARLVRAIDTDLPHVRMHTRLQVKAIEWDRRGRDDSFLLRKRDLSDAESWLAASAGKEPTPTPLQQEYIITSRKVENEYNQLIARGEQAVRRVKVAAIVVPLAILTATGAGVFAMTAIKRADDATQIAQNAKTKQQDAEEKAHSAEGKAANAEEKARDATRIADNETKKAKRAEGKLSNAQAKLTDTEARRKDAELKVGQAVLAQRQVQAKLLEQIGLLKTTNADLNQKKRNIRDVWAFSKALAEMFQGRHDNAIKLLREVVNKNPLNGFAYSGLGFVYQDKKNFSAAEAEFRKAIKVDRNDPTAWDSLGTVLYDQRRLDEAIAAYRKAVEIDPKFAQAYSNLGVALADQQKLDEAIAAYRKAIKIDPKDALAYYNLGLTLSDQQKLDEAIAAYRRAIEIDPKFAQAYSSLGLTLSDQQRLDEATAAYRKAIEINPKYAPAYNNLGLALAK